MATAKKEPATTEEVKKPAAKKTAPKAKAEVKKETPKTSKVSSDKYVARLKKKYDEEVVKALIEKYQYKSVMQVPHIEKIVVNVGVGDATSNSKLLDDSVRELSEITGQKPVVTKSKKSIASFKLREGMPIGCKVTLRGTRMYEFLDKLVTISLPRVRDFRGVSKNAFDGRGNYTLGVKEHLIFPEIDFDKVSKTRGMDIVIVTTANTDEEAYTLLEMLGMPFHK